MKLLRFEILKLWNSHVVKLLRCEETLRLWNSYVMKLLRYETLTLWNFYVMKLGRYETLTLWNSYVMELLRYVMLHQVPFTYIMLRFVAVPEKRQAMLNWIRTFTDWLIADSNHTIRYGR